MQIRSVGVTFAAIGAGALLPGAAAAQTAELTLTIPQLRVAEYHRPYVAVWLEKDGAPAKTLAVWYDTGKRNNAGTKWLRDVRSWWRVAGRTSGTDGVSGATRAAGTHKLSFTAGKGPLPALAPGNYTIVIEAAREAGGREVLRLPFRWPTGGAATVRAAGKFELGAVSLTVKR